MLDMHVLYNSVGNTSLTAPTVIPTGDGQVVAGVPLLSTPKVATLAAWGGVAVDGTKAIKEIKMSCNDLNDPVNGSDWKITGTAANITSPTFFEALPYQTAARSVSIAQKAAGACFAFLIDHYQPQDARCLGVFRGTRMPQMRNMYQQLFGGAITANVWTSQAFTPAQNLPMGKYAILGAWANNLTNCMAIRFQHADFGMAQPGFIIPDTGVVANTPDLFANDDLLMHQGFQFVRMSELTAAPQCPVFRAGANGTGLNIWAYDLTADTPTVVLNLVYLGG